MDQIFDLSPSIRYAAINSSGRLITRQRENAANASEAESDKYEELLVNPTLLHLAKQRGNIDCGGATFLVVGYGNFDQLVVDLPDGHVSVCFEKAANPIEYVDRVREAALTIC